MKTYMVGIRDVLRSARGRLNGHGVMPGAGLLVLVVLIVGVHPGRAVAAECGNQQFRVGPSAQLPDCRAYEQATPVDKGGGSIAGTIGQVKAAEDGSGVTFFSQAGIPGGVGSQEFPMFMSSRGASSWSTQGLLPPSFYGDQANVRGFSSNLRYVAIEAVKSSTKSEFTGEAALLLKDTATQQFEVIVPYAESEISPAFILAGVSSVGDQVFFEAKVPLGLAAAPEQQNLFMWSRATHAISLVGVVPTEGGEEAAPEGSFAGPYRWWAGQTQFGGAYDNFYTAEEHATSENGDEAFFTERNSGKLYLRRGLTGNSPSTVWVSESKKTNGTGENGRDPFGPQPAAFMMATADGSKAFFTSHEELTNDADTGEEDRGNDLYSYDTRTGQLVDLTAFEATETETPNGAEVQGMVGMSKDGAFIYLVANGVLAPGATPGSCSSEEEGGICNLYRYAADGPGPHFTFIAQLEGSSEGGRLNGDARNWSPNSIRTGSLATFREPTARVSSDGQTLLFRTYRPLTGYNNSGCEGEFEELGSAGRCPEFFRYSAANGEIVCVSCNPTGAAPLGAPSLRSRTLFAFVGSGVVNRLATQTRNLSEDGDEVFFETPDSLVPGDVNGEGACRFLGKGPQENSCQDVYEWEEQGSPSCPVPTAPGGCLFLISTGQSQFSSNIADVSANGEDVFFFTQSQLVPSDRDGLIDIYDARVGGGLASQNEVPPPECVGEGCQGAPLPAPGATEVGSSGFNGPENPRTKPIHKKKQPKKHKKHKHKKQGRKAKTCSKQGRHCKKHPGASPKGAKRTASNDRGGAR